MPAVDKKKRTHHPMGHSKFGLFYLCPAAFFELTKALKAEQFKAIRGNVIHDAIEREDPSELTGFDRQDYDTFMGFVEETREGIPGEVQKTTKEEKVSVMDGKRELQYGYLDWADKYEHGGIVYDAKTHPTGSVPETITRWQITLGCIGKLQQHPTHRSWRGYAVLTHQGDYLECEVKRAQLDSYVEKIKEVQDKAYAPVFSNEPTEPEYHPGVEQCSSCPAIGWCDHARLEFSQIEIHDMPGIATLPDGEFEIIDQELFGRAVAVAKTRQKMDKSFLDLAKRVLSSSESDYAKLQNSGATTSFGDTEKARDRLTADMRLFLSQPQPPTPARLKSYFQEIKGVSAAKAKVAVDADFGDLIVSTPKSPSIVLTTKGKSL